MYGGCKGVQGDARGCKGLGSAVLQQLGRAALARRLGVDVRAQHALDAVDAARDGRPPVAPHPRAAGLAALVLAVARARPALAVEQQRREARAALDLGAQAVPAARAEQP